MRKPLSMAKLGLLLGLVAVCLLFPILWRSASKLQNISVTTHQTEKEYVAELAPRVKEIAAFYGVKPSVVLGQILLSSDYGQSLLAKRYHNLLNLEAKSGQDFVDMTVTLGDGTTANKRLAVFSDWDEGLIAYMEGLRQGDYGKDVYEAMATSKDYKALAKLLQASDVTSGSDYAKKLVEVIETYHLTKYDN